PPRREDPRDHGVRGRGEPDDRARRLLRDPADSSRAARRGRLHAGAERRIFVGRGDARRAGAARAAAMKVVTWFGTRPEIIRLSRVIPALDAHCTQRLVHTGQNYDESLSDVFFRDLGVRAPDVHLGIAASDFGAQAGAILERSYAFLQEERPDRLLILGDTNSGLAAISPARLGI